jgi:pimeloyl-ACP methyl ester carboxylesterase
MPDDADLPTTHELRTPDGRVLRFCLYGPELGHPVVFHSGSPSTRFKRPDVVTATNQSPVRLLVADRPGYGGSTRWPHRTVADVVTDTRLLVDALGWSRFAIAGAALGRGP